MLVLSVTLFSRILIFLQQVNFEFFFLSIFFLWCGYKLKGCVYSVCSNVFKRLQFTILRVKLSTGLKPAKRDEIQQEWMDGKVQVIVATISFGMGVDKASVR